MKTDVKNAFNSVSRDQIMEQVSLSFPDIHNHVIQMYGKPSSLVFMRDTSPVIIASEEGVHQGDPLGPVTFATAIHSVLTNVQNSHPSVRVLAYLDDVFLLGEAEDVLAAFCDLKKSFLAINLVIADKKCEIFSPSSSTVVKGLDGVPVSNEGALFLGSPIGTASFVTSSCTTIAQSKISLCNQLTKLDDVQSAMLLLRCCHVPSLNHLARTVQPDLLVPASTIHDSKTKETFSELLGYDMIADKFWLQASLPIRLGGFGMIPLLSVRQPAFVASWANVITNLPFRFPDLRPLIDTLLSSSSSPISEALAQSVPPGKHISDYLSSVEKVQHQLSSVAATSKAQNLLDNFPTARDAAHLRSSKGKGAGAWLNAIPTLEVFALSSCEFRLASFLRLGLPMSLSNWTTTCNCGADIDDSGYHLLTCKTGGGPVWSHESISSIWSDCFRMLRIHHRREPRNRYTTTDNRPDIIFFDSDTGYNIDLDISLAHPWSSDIFPTSAGVDRAAADRRADRKRPKYNKQQLPGGSIVSAIPLVMEHFGAWGFDAWKFLKR